MMGYELIRLALLELDRRWDLGNDIFILHLDELEQFEPKASDLRREIARRKIRWKSVQRLELPDGIDSDGLSHSGLPQVFENATEWIGAPVSAGVATGTARIVFNPREVEELGTDYVLVCPSPDPGWTPFFINARGLMVERGIAKFLAETHRPAYAHCSKTSSPIPMPSLRIPRRDFLRTSALAAGAAVIGAPAFLRGQNLNSRLNIGIIGCGGRGGFAVKGAANENIVALCDINEERLDKVLAANPKARRYVDFRKLLAEAKDLDAITVATAEHTHAFATLGALQLKKHVYCEKPLTHSIGEARIIADAAAQAKVATQMGTQNHANPNFHRVIELVRSGAIGPVREAHVWVSRAWGWQTPEEAVANKDIVSAQERPAGSSPVPAGVNWDLFLGPAPERPFHEVYWPGPKWYRWWDFGSGTMSDMGSHLNDLPFWALKLDAPLTIEAEGPPPHAEIAPASMLARYTYGARGDMPPVTMTWYQGTQKPPQFTEGKIPPWGMAILFVGDKGMLLADYSRHILLPEEKFKDFKRPEPFIPHSPGHFEEWLLACKAGTPTGSNFDYAAKLTIANHLGNVAYRLGKKIEWDPVNLKAKNTPEADRLIHKTYRKGWALT